jgi:two-component system chemotaxis sensor kinase CheA
MGDQDDIVREFLVESFEGLDRLDRDLVALEGTPTDQELLAAIFRCVHTIKGTCGFLGFSTLESLTHAGENLLSQLRDGDIELTGALNSALLEMVDAVREILMAIEAQGDEGRATYGAIVQRLQGLAGTNGDSHPAEVAPVTKGVEAPLPVVVFETRVSESEPDEAPEPAASDQSPDPAADTGTLEERSAVTESSIRVDVALLDTLMNLVGELVLVRNQILQAPALRTDATLAGAAQGLNHITTELQEGVMKTRMQPIGNVWNKFPRVVRDLARACGKVVRIEMQGRDTELDKTLIEAIKDPLTHLVRNAVDHGIEDSAVRRARSKPAEGCLQLRAYHEGGQVNIEIADDGGGIDADRIKAKAVERGIVTGAAASEMSEREALKLIFVPGFSTAASVTNVSGRGVGMDVVRTNIEKIGGHVEVHSALGRGTSIKVKIPLTLAIVPALIVRTGDEHYAIPQASLLELVRLSGADAGTRIENLHGAPVYRLRGRLLPLVFLDRELGLCDSNVEAAHDRAFNIVVLQANDRQFGLIVDGVTDTAEIVVKPLGRMLKGLSVYAGATIMGDGRIALILDVLGLAQRTGVLAETHRHAHATEASDHAAGVKQSALLFATSTKGRMAIPLDQVDRLEEFPRSAIERASGRDVIQYRGTILPLVDVAAVLGEEPVLRTSERVNVVVYAAQGRLVGFVVDRILDVVEMSDEVMRASTRDGVVGSVVVQDRVTDVVDVARVAEVWEGVERSTPRSKQGGNGSGVHGPSWQRIGGRAQAAGPVS